MNGTGPTPLLELACLAIVLLYVVVRGLRDPAPRGTIIRTQPPGGTSVRAGSRVRLTVSLGRPAPRD